MKPSVSVPISLAGLPLLLGLWGCSAAIALSQYSERTSPYLTEDKVTRAEVESELGTPVTTWVFDDGSSLATYQEKVYYPMPDWWTHYWTKKSPGFRAFEYVLYDVTTLGLMEVLTTPMEAGVKIYRAAKGTTYEVTVAYDPTGRVVDVSWREAGSQGGAKSGN